MLIFAIIPIIFLILSYKNFKLAFLAYVAFKMLAVSAVIVQFSPMDSEMLKLPLCMELIP